MLRSETSIVKGTTYNEGEIKYMEKTHFRRAVIRGGQQLNEGCNKDCEEDCDVEQNVTNRIDVAQCKSGHSTS